MTSFLARLDAYISPGYLVDAGARVQASTSFSAQKRYAQAELYQLGKQNYARHGVGIAAVFLLRGRKWSINTKGCVFRLLQILASQRIPIANRSMPQKGVGKRE